MRNLAVIEPIWSNHSLPPREVKRTRHFWTNKEVETVRQLYPSGGLVACMEALPGRTASGIYQRAGILGLKRPHKQPRRKEPWTTNQFIDDRIRRAYANPTNNSVNDCARAVARPRWWVSKRAAALGLIAPRFREPTWTPAEDELLAEHAHKKPSAIRSIMKRRGFARSDTAIAVRRKRLSLSSIDPDNYTSRGLAVMFGIDSHAITNWIQKGWLKAKPRGTDRVAVQGGDMWSIKRKDVRQFIIENTAAVDIRKVDKHWFVDLLAN